MPLHQGDASPEAPPNWEQNSAVLSSLTSGPVVDLSQSYGLRLRDSLSSSRPGRWARAEAATYANGEDRPLGSYMVLMGAYSGLVVSAAAAVRISGRSLKKEFSTRDVLLIALATHKFARMLSKDPITSPLRAPFTSFEGTSADAELAEAVRGKGLQHAIGELLTCPLCLDQWVATALLFGLILLPRTTRFISSLFAVVALADAAHHLYAHLQQ